ncbi:MAG: pyruvate kinase [Verrucomicrobiota bacterium]
MPIHIDVLRLKKRRTKILATVGPASSGADALTALLDQGVDVFRLNFSHGDHATHEEVFRRIRELSVTREQNVAILADLCGPKIRVGRFRDGAIELEPGAEVTMTVRPVEGEPGLIPCVYEPLASDLRPGDRILLADGMLELRAESIEGTEILCTVVQGGLLKDRKGLNLPGSRISSPALTEKDVVDARFALGLGVDYLALSFVREASDIADLRTVMDEEGRRASIIAKIERPEALTNFEGILEAADGIMVARGDLGVELDPEKVPMAQRLMIDGAREVCKPVIVATQMLESMVEHARPTRAEVSDVSTAVLSGVDAVMLSAETAVGAYPDLAVKMMDEVARETEGYQSAHDQFESLMLLSDDSAASSMSIGHAMARATAQLSRDLDVRSIVVASESGVSVLEVSSARPSTPILALSSCMETCRKVQLLWGVVAQRIEVEDLERIEDAARAGVRQLGLAEEGQYILLVRGYKSDAKLNHPTVGVLLV